MEWVEREETLLDADGRPVWLEHPTLRNRADIAAIRLSNVDGVEFFLYNIDNDAFKELLRRVQTEHGLQVTIRRWQA